MNFIHVSRRKKGILIMTTEQMLVIARSHYPRVLGIRKRLQKIKVDRLSRFLMNAEEVQLCEEDIARKSEIIARYTIKSAQYLAPALDEIKDIFSKSEFYRNRVDAEDVKIDMLFCRLAYGFLPSEYICFELEGKTPSQRREFVSDLDMLQFGYTVNDIVEVQKIFDKADSYCKFKKYYKRDAIVVEKSKDYDAFSTFVHKHPVFVKKAVFSDRGRGVEVVKIAGGGV